jgi:hypothetical protein
MNRVLVDSSVWIEYFQSETKHSDIDDLIDGNLLCTNDLILAELLPFLYIEKENELIESLNSLEKVDIDISWDIIVQMQIQNIKNGINGVGIPDLIILQNVIENNLVLYSADKHFRLMKKIFDFKLAGSDEDI